MQDDGSRMLGLAGLQITGAVLGEGDRCPHCGGQELHRREHRDLPVRLVRGAPGLPSA
jgi:hypothetical protein